MHVAVVILPVRIYKQLLETLVHAIVYHIISNAVKA